jgi:hypothetical protein
MGGWICAIFCQAAGMGVKMQVGPNFTISFAPRKIKAQTIPIKAKKERVKICPLWTFVRGPVYWANMVHF